MPPAIEIAFAACALLHTSGLPDKTQCREFTIPLTSSSSFACMVGGQTELARWVNEHPNWALQPGYRCRRVGEVARI